MDVTFEMATGRQFTIEVWYFATVREMKEAVYRREGISVESQRLFLDGIELDDTRDTKHYSICQGSRLLLLLPDDCNSATTAMSPSEVMDVTFETLTGWQFTVEVLYFATVREMKETVHRCKGIPVELQRLFLDGIELDDARDTEYYKMIQGTRILLLLPDDDDCTVAAVFAPANASDSD